MAGLRVAATLESLLARHRRTASLVRAYARLVPGGWPPRIPRRLPDQRRADGARARRAGVADAGRTALAAWAGAIERSLLREACRRGARRASRARWIALLQGAMLQRASPARRAAGRTPRARSRGCWTGRSAEPR
jgi:hypothetical protein